MNRRELAAPLVAAAVALTVAGCGATSPSPAAAPNPVATAAATTPAPTSATAETLTPAQREALAVVEYDFTTGYGGREHFTYDYRVVDGAIRDVVGRYV